MNEHDRILCVLNKEGPDKIPWVADLSYLYESKKILGTLDKKYLGESGYLRFHNDLGAGICFYAPFPWKSCFTENVSCDVKVSNRVRKTVYATPVGIITSTEKYLPETFSWALTDHLVKTIDDLRVMEYIHRNTVYSRNYEEYDRISKLWGGAGIASAFPPISSAPLQKLIARWAGIENTVSILIDYPDESGSLLDAIDESQSVAFEILCESSCEYVEFAENLSSEVTGATLFKKYNMPHYIKRNRLLHEAGKYTGIHIDGTLKPCLSMLSDCGFDAAEAVTPMPIGDIPIENLRNEADGDIVIWGGLPGALFSPLYTDEQFHTHLIHVLEVFQSGSGYILGVADQVPPDGLISRVKMVREMAEA